MHGRRGARAALVALVLASAPLSATAAPQAEAPRTTVLPLAVDAKLEAHWTDRMQQGVARGLRRGDFTLAPSDAMAEATAKHPQPCASVECRAAIAESTGSDYVVAGSVVQTLGGDFTLSLALADASGAELARTEATCELCGAADVVTKLEDLAASLRERLDSLTKDAPRLSLHTRPPGARVAIDGEPNGVSPVELTFAAGEHRVDVELEGHNPVQLRITGVAGVVDRRDLILTPTTDPSVPRLRAAGFALLGVGLGALPAGIVLVAIDSRQYRRDCQPDINGTCRRSYDTIAAGITTLVSGAVVAAAGATLLGVARRRRGTRRRSARLRLGADLALHFP
ncbi:MAG: PEGA domain-containing protein [Myxococcota bacterium]